MPNLWQREPVLRRPLQLASDGRILPKEGLAKPCMKVRFARSHSPVVSHCGVILTVIHWLQPPLFIPWRSEVTLANRSLLRAKERPTLHREGNSQPADCNSKAFLAKLPWPLGTMLHTEIRGRIWARPERSQRTLSTHCQVVIVRWLNGCFCVFFSCPRTERQKNWSS